MSHKIAIHVNSSGVVRVNGDQFQCATLTQAKYLAAIMRRVHDDGYIEGRNGLPRWRCGWLLNKHSLWMGVHYSTNNKRWCINLIPCVTFWITKPGGNTP